MDDGIDQRTTAKAAHQNEGEQHGDWQPERDCTQGDADASLNREPF